jgi:hypothetical protein
MPVTNPIDGAYFFPESKTYVAEMATTVGLPITLPAVESAQLRGPIEKVWYHTMTAGPRNYDPALTGISAGSSESLRHLALEAFEVQGLLERPGRADITVAPPASYWPFSGALELVNNDAIRATAFGCAVVNGRALVKPRPLSMSVRAFTEREARLALQVSQAGRQYRAAQGISVGLAPIEETIIQSAEVRAAETFFILVDIVGSAIVNPGPSAGTYYPFQDVTAQLLINGVEWEIEGSSFDFNMPADKLGATLNIRLANIAGIVALNAAVDFRLVLTDHTGEVHYISLIGEGKVGGRDVTIQWTGNGPGDTLSISALDIVVDRFALHPLRSVVMFDPDKTPYSSVEGNPRDGVEDEKSGAIILPLVEPAAHLTWQMAAKRAYTSSGGVYHMRFTPGQVTTFQRISGLINQLESNSTKGLGFAGLVTNIPDYPVSRVDFTAEGGWHDGIQPCIGMYNPIYFVEGGQLFIVDTFRALPYGHITYGLTPESDYSVLAGAVPFREPFNIVYLTYQARDGEAGITIAEEWLDDDVQESGHYGDFGYQQTTIKQRVLRARDQLGAIVNEEPSLYRQEVRSTTVWWDGQELVPGPVMLSHREEQQDFFHENFKTGHHKEVWTQMTVGVDASLALVKVLTEDCAISWDDAPDGSGQKVQKSSVTRIEGLIYMEPDDTVSRLNPSTGDTYDRPKMWPLTVADAGEVITDTGNTFWGPIKTITETLRSLKGGQLDMMVREKDEIKGSTRNSFTSPRVSSGLLSANKYETKSHTVRIMDEANILAIGPRRPESVNAGELPRARAFELAHRVLAQGPNPVQEFRINLPGVDVGLRRGSVVRACNREGVWSPPCMVRGLTITGTSLGTTGHRIATTLDTVELR